PIDESPLASATPLSVAEFVTPEFGIDIWGSTILTVSDFGPGTPSLVIVTGSAPESAGASTSAGTPVPARTVGSDTKLVGVLSDSAAVAVPVISPEARSIEADVPGSTIPRSAAC